MNQRSPVISVSGHLGDQAKDVACQFEHEGLRVHVQIPNAVTSSTLDDEHARARPVLLAALEALVAALKQ